MRHYGAAFTWTAAVSVALLLGACSSGAAEPPELLPAKPSLQGTAPGTGDPLDNEDSRQDAESLEGEVTPAVAFAGLWDAPTIYPDGTTDDFYVHFSDEGDRAVLFDYDADSYGTGRNCFFRSEVAMEKVAENVYEINGIATYFSLSTNMKLTVVNMEASGKFVEESREIYARIEGLAISDIVICE